MMRKITKKILQIFLKILLIFVALDLLIVLFVFTPPTQKLIIDRVTSSISKATKSNFDIQKIYITPTFRIKAKGVVIQDHHGNNMISAQEVSGKLNVKKFSPNSIYLKDIVLKNPDLTLRTYKGEDVVNLNLWVTHFGKSSSTETFVLHLKEITMINGRFAVINDNTRSYKNDHTIDYGFFEFKNINASIHHFLVNGPEVSCQIQQVSTEQYTGFKIKTFKGDFKINSNELLVSNCSFTTDKSKANLNFAFRYNQYKDYSDFFNKIRFDVDVKSSTVHMDDIACFAPAIEGMHNSIIINGKGEGPLNALTISHCYMKYKLASFISGDFSFFNILDFKNSSYDFQIQHSSLLLSELNQFYLPGGTQMMLPEMVTRIGTASVTGGFQGTINYFNTNLNCKTPIGNASVFLKTSPNSSLMDFIGAINTKDFNLGKLLQDTKHLGFVNGDFQFTGTAAPFFADQPFIPSLKANVKGNLKQFDFCAYPATNIVFDARYEENNYFANVMINDQNIDFDFEGWVNLKESLPRYKTNIQLNKWAYGEVFKNYPYPIDTLKPDLLDYLVQYARKKPDLTLSVNSLDAEIKGSTLQNFTGFIGLNKLMILNENDTATCDWLRLNSIYLPEDVRKFILKGNILNANLTTNYRLDELGDSLVQIAAYYFPSLFPEYVEKQNNITTDEIEPAHFLSLSLETFSTRRFMDIFVPGLRIAQNSTVDLYIGQTRSLDSIDIKSGRIRWENQYRIVNINVKGKMEENQNFNLTLNADSAIIFRSKSDWDFRHINLSTAIKNQVVQFNLAFVSPDTLNLKNSSKLTGYADFSKKEDLYVKIMDAQVFLRESIWSVIGKNEVHFQKDKIKIEDLVLVSKLGKIEVNGAYSNSNDEDLDLKIENFDVSLINAITSQINIHLDGNMSALMTYQSRQDHSTLIGKSYFENFEFNEEELGTLFVFAEAPVTGSPVFFGGLFVQDTIQKLGKIEQYNILNFEKGRIKLADLRGTYISPLKELRIIGDIDTVRIGFLSPFLASFSNHVSGVASGELSFIANPDSLYFDGIVHIKEALLGIAPLNTIYKIKDQLIKFDSKGISFDNIQVTDKFNNKATVDGYVYHHNFSTFNVNLNIETQRILAMSRVKKTDTYFYGDAFASGIIRIFGDTKKLTFSGDNLKSLPGTLVGFPISYASTSYEDRGIRFITPTQNILMDKPKMIDSPFEMDFDLVFDVNRDADVRIDLDPIDGVLDCKTNGKIRLTYNSKSDALNMDGRLDLLSGTFSMSLKNLLPRKFDLLEGGNINFVGPIKSSTISLTALYPRTVSLKTLSEDIEVNKTQVNAYLSLSGDLMNPQPSFSFGFPKLTSEEEKQVFSVLDTTDSQNNLLQFFSLVYLGTFYSTTTELTDVQAVDASMQVLASTISNMVLQEIKFVDMNLNVLSANQYFKEYSLDVDKPFYNDRIRVKTRLGYAESLTQQTANSNFIGDVSFEYLINKEGNWILRLFYFNDQTILNDFYQNLSRPTQGGGVGLIYKQEFYGRKNLEELKKDRKTIQSQTNP